jgi:predicted DNA-binding transcriptional regulator AlpA
MSDDADELLTVKDVERIYRISPAAQRTWRLRREGLGPLSFKLGSRIVYRRSEVVEWIAEQERSTRN